MTIVKICGLTSTEDALAAVTAGADWLGLNFYPGSKRHVTPERGRQIAADIRAASPGTRLVGVFVNAPLETVNAVEDVLDYLQFHGDEAPADCGRWGERAIKAFRLATPADLPQVGHYNCELILLDAPSADYGGSGQIGNWNVARMLVKQGQKLLLAGGLVPENVAAAMRAVRPFGVDVASGVEREPGKKDRDKMQRFIDAVRGAT